MPKEDKTIHDFDYKLICEYFCGVKQQGPGSPETTLKALSFINRLNEKSHIADIGCGTGAPTMMLAKNTKGQITAIDLFPEFIEKLNSNAKKLGFQKRVKGIAKKSKSASLPEKIASIFIETPKYITTAAAKN